MMNEEVHKEDVNIWSGGIGNSSRRVTSAAKTSNPFGFPKLDLHPPSRSSSRMDFFSSSDEIIGKKSIKFPDVSSQYVTHTDCWQLVPKERAAADKNSPFLSLKSSTCYCDTFFKK